MLIKVCRNNADANRPAQIPVRWNVAMRGREFQAGQARCWISAICRLKSRSLSAVVSQVEVIMADFFDRIGDVQGLARQGIELFLQPVA